MNLVNFIKHVYIFGLLSVLTACGDSSETNSNEPEPIIPVTVNDAIQVMATDSRQKFNITPYINSHSNGAQLINAHLLSHSVCEDVRIEGLFIDLRAIKEGVCELEYTVQSIAFEGQTSTRDSGKLVVISSESQQTDFVPISATLSVGQQTLIDLTTELDSEFPVGYDLSPEVVVLGSGHISVDTNLATINYSATTAGLSRLVYTFNNGANSKMGYIDVSVSEEGTRPPSTAKVNYPNLVALNQTVYIDLSPYVSDPDGDDLQLVEVMSFHAEVKPVSPDDIINKVFSFQTNKAGLHYVSYMVSDHRGGFSSNLVEITVVDSSQLAQWTDITMGLSHFSAPLTALEATDGAIQFSGTHSDTGFSPAINMASMTFDEAKQYCTQFGRLPTVDELINLARNELPANKHNWPKEALYFANDEGVASLVEFDSGNHFTAVQGTFYVTCISPGALSVSPIHDEAIANGIDIAEFEAELILNGQGVDGEELTASVNGNAVLESNTVITSNGGKARFRLHSYVAETNQITVDYKNLQQAVQSIKFIGDTDHSRVVSLNILKNNANANGTDTNLLIARVEDDLTNPVENARVDILLTENLADNSATAPSSLITNAQGEVSINITNTAEEGVWVRAYYTSTNTPPEISYQDQYINFYHYNEVPPTEAVGLIWAAPFTESEALKVGVTPDMIHEENGTNGPSGMTVSQFSWLNADDFCYFLNYFGLTGWRLPTEAELTALYNDAAISHPVGKVYEKYGWPTQIALWSSDSEMGGTYRSVRLWDGTLTNDSSTANRYTGCVHSIVN